MPYVSSTRPVPTCVPEREHPGHGPRESGAHLGRGGRVDASVHGSRLLLERCLHDGITTIDVDLTTVGRCDNSGLRVFLDASRHAAGSHASPRLHHPSSQTARLLTDTGSDLLLL
ncbi:Anti-anti-sigma regulatory factor (antagonist of anti-sigma factor) [Streptomyces sp. 3214.6]|nr:Anti-anti-sigma regulatory factor (antagonist of anti-sigma factor) [Streptomyces sp. 3214.6]